MGPRKRWLLVFALCVAALYWPLTRVAEPALRELHYQLITRTLATDASGLRPPEKKLWLGATRPELPWSTRGLGKLEQALGQELAIASFYQAWGAEEEHQFPDNVVRSLRKGGYLPFITWEPWLSAFPRYDGKEPQAGLRRIIAGEHDEYVRRYAREATRYGEPLLLRVAHEPSNPNYAWAPEHGNTPADYRAFWHHVRSIFQEEGARNVVFVWTPFGYDDRDFFPGPKQVDWIGLNIFNYGSLSEEGKWLSFAELAKLQYDSYATLGPPLLVAETATTSAGGNKVDWLRGMFHTLQTTRFPKIRAVVLFDQPRGESPAGIPLDWSLSETPEIFTVLKNEPQLLEPFTDTGVPTR